MYAVFAGGCLFWFSFPVASRQSRQNIKEMYLVLVISREHFPMPKSWLLQTATEVELGGSKGSGKSLKDQRYSAACDN